MTDHRPDRGAADPADEFAGLRLQIEELRRALTAIREGDVDAVVLSGPQGQQLYTLVSADRPYRVIVEEMGDGAVTVSERGIVLFVNRRLADLVGTDRAALLGKDVADLVEASAADTLASLLRTEPGTTRHGELLLAGAAGSSVPALASVTGLDIEGTVVRCLIVTDLTDRRRNEQELVGAHADLTRSTRELEEAQRIGRIGSWFWDAATGELDWSTQMFRIFGGDPRATGETARQALAAASHPEDAAAATAVWERALVDHQPFVFQQRCVRPDGSLRHTVTRGEVISRPDSTVTGMRGTTQDVTEQRRAAEAVAEAREALVRQTMELAEEHRVKESLQRAILPADLPTAPGVELAARYLPADRPSLVGGDWYDAFWLPDGFLAVAVGDVVGHDLDAAATMGQVRNALRAYAFSEGTSAAVLTRLNALTTGLGERGLATCVYGRLEPSRLSLSWASAGHPPPLLISRAGARLLTNPSGMMLGASSGSKFLDALAPLLPDDLVVLYTDGLIERRDQDLDAGFAALVDAAQDLVRQPAATVCDALLDRLLPTYGHEDDVCLLAIRLTTHTGVARPAEQRRP